MTTDDYATLRKNALAGLLMTPIGGRHVTDFKKIGEQREGKPGSRRRLDRLYEAKVEGIHVVMETREYPGDLTRGCTYFFAPPDKANEWREDVARMMKVPSEKMGEWLAKFDGKV